MGETPSQTPMNDGESGPSRGLEEVSPPEPDSVAAAQQAATDRLRTWKRWYLLWTAIHYLLNIAAITATVLGAALASVLDYESHKTLYTVLSIVAVMFVFLVAFTSPTRQSRAYIAAWRDLSLKYIEFQLNRASLDDLLGSIQRGEEIIGGKDPF